jgi:hypothetical protein
MVIVIIAVRVAFSPHRNSVFDVFRAAGSRWLAADDLYPRAGEFLYSPLAAAFFAPFARLPAALGGILWRLGTALPYFLIANLWLEKNYPESARARGVGLLFLLALSAGNFNNGQASPLVLALLCGALIAAGSERWNLAALCIAVAAFFKLYPFAFGLLLAALYPRKLIWRLAVMAGALFLLSLLLQKPGYALAQYRNWFACLGADHRRLADGVGYWRDVWLLLRLAGIPISVAQYAAVQVASGVALACFCIWVRRVKRWAVDRLLLGVLALGACWVVLFGPSTELATYVFLAPAFAVAGASVFGNANGPKPTGPLHALLLGSFIWLATAELLNAWVPPLRRSLPLHALQPIGALAFCAFVLAWLLDDGWWRPRILPAVPANEVLQRR